MTKVCTHGRGADLAMKMLDESLRRLQTDRIDLLQFHEVIRMTDPERVFGPGGALEAVVAAQRAGKIRYVGFTGHKSPAIHLRMHITTASRSRSCPSSWRETSACWG
jgi:aryl-alcohol dehydrogenase-like predicted oxidoreductase